MAAKQEQISKKSKDSEQFFETICFNQTFNSRLISTSLSPKICF